MNRLPQLATISDLRNNHLGVFALLEKGPVVLVNRTQPQGILLYPDPQRAIPGVGGQARHPGKCYLPPAPGRAGHAKLEVTAVDHLVLARTLSLHHRHAARSALVGARPA